MPGELREYSVKETSFSEEKEAKRLSSVGLTPGTGCVPWILSDEVFWFFCSQKNIFLLIFSLAFGTPLAAAGDPARGQAIVTSRQTGLCLLCHSGPFADPHLQGTIGPSLAGIGARLGEAEIRARVAHASHANPGSIMPDYAATSDLRRVAEGFAGKPILTDTQIDDVAAYLATLRTP